MYLGLTTWLMENYKDAYVDYISNAFDEHIQEWLDYKDKQTNIANARPACAMCELDDYHDSDQYVCDGCLGELEALAAEQSASKYD